MPVMLMVLAAAYGAAAGLLLPRPVHRLSVPPEEAWRTTCPGGHPITGPAYGWLGPARCRACGPRASGPYGPAALGTAALTAVVCGVLAGATGPRPELAAWLLMAPVAVLLGAVDRRVHRLPDALTLPLAAGAALLLGVLSALPGAAGSWGGALLGGLALGGFYGVLYVINPAGMGLGDVKLALGLGVALGWYGWTVVLAGGFLGLLLGAVYGAGLLLTGRGGRKSAVPYGPFMIIGAGCGVLLGGATVG
ncbi:A24 family peptidase [Streptomyces sp. NPDC003077]|uniref:A24 family peptidase n=1 Tax=Streptomyces sp. NPDC003077 TaxID=3154443 RepID=UPI0033B3E8B3